MLPRQFPIIQCRSVSGVQPKSVPWKLLLGHENQAFFNHGQSLERLAERGGLDIFELWCVVHDKPWKERASLREVYLWLKPIENVVW